PLVFKSDKAERTGHEGEFYETHPFRGFAPRSCCSRWQRTRQALLDSRAIRGARAPRITPPQAAWKASGRLLLFDGGSRRSAVDGDLAGLHRLRHLARQVDLQ